MRIVSMTKKFLESKIKSVYDDFINESWCDLNGKDLNTDGYNSLVYQQKYILKYYGAYFCELYEMYEDFFNTFTGKTVNILSLGCGSGVDCEALNRVVIDLKLNITINYVGIDIVDWSYRPQFDWATFKTMCVSKLKIKDIKHVHLFVFPKSLTELELNTLRLIGNLISESNKNDCVYFLNTYVTDYANDSNRIDGIRQFGIIHGIMKNNDWKCMTSPSEYYYKTRQNWLGYSYDFFKLPDEVKPFVEKLKDSCNNHNRSKKCMNCDIDFIPILTGRYLAFNLLGYKRLQ